MAANTRRLVGEFTEISFWLGDAAGIGVGALQGRGVTRMRHRRCSRMTARSAGARRRPRRGSRNECAK
jgi:hypothetical protein